MLEPDKIESHESFGMVGLSRLTGSRSAMFGSSIEHHSFIRLTIRRAEGRRSLSRDWYFGKQELVEVDLSPTQYADMITAMNVGSGVPCTIRSVNNEAMAECPAVEQREKFVHEFKADVKKAMADAAKIASEAAAILAKPNLLKSDRASLANMLEMLMQHINSNMPFVQKQFNEAMDKTVTECKGEVEAFISNKIMSLGLEALRDQMALPEIADAKRPALIEAE